MGRKKSVELSSKAAASKFLVFLNDMLRITEKPYTQIAEEIGFNNSNVISMFKSGLTRVPLTRVPALAKALHVDPAYMMRLHMQEYDPETYQAVTNCVGFIVTANEIDLIKGLRERLPGDPVFNEHVLDGIEKLMAKSGRNR